MHPILTTKVQLILQGVNSEHWSLRSGRSVRGEMWKWLWDWHQKFWGSPFQTECFREIQAHKIAKRMIWNDQSDFLVKFHTACCWQWWLKFFCLFVFKESPCRPFQKGKSSSSTVDSNLLREYSIHWTLDRADPKAGCQHCWNAGQGDSFS